MTTVRGVVLGLVLMLFMLLIGASSGCGRPPEPTHPCHG
jgi:hypothetical protein